MANLREASVWEAGIYQFETSDPVMGGENGIDNRPTRQLANRTLWLKAQIAAAVESIGNLGNSKADKTITLTAGNGLSGGGTLAANRTISLGTPGTITASSTNLVTATSHTHAIDSASTTKAGVVMLVNDLASDDTDKALTAAQGKVLGAGKADKTINITAGNGLTGGGTLSAGRTITLGTPGKITATSTNDVSATSHTHEIDNASLTTAGVVRLSNAIDSAAVNMAATPKAVMDALQAANNGNLTMHGALGTKNLNDLKGEAHYGVHWQSGNAAATNERNYPVQRAGTLLVLPSAYQGRQVYIPFDLPIIYLRGTNSAGEYGAWSNVGGVENSLNSARGDVPLAAAQGKTLNETKLGNSGNQTLSNGVLNIERNAWEKLRFTNPDGSRWRFEAEPVSSGADGARFNFVFTGADNAEVGRVAFPRVGSGETAAYQSWVNARIEASKTPYLQTVDYHADQSLGYEKTGFYRSNGRQMDGNALPLMEIHITHPGFPGNSYARGIGFSYGPNFGVFTTSWDANGVYQGSKVVLTEENGLMRTDRSNAVNLDDQDKVATSRAVKIAYDKAASVEATVITAGNGLSGGGNLTANRTLSLGTPGTITATSANSVSATSHTHAIDSSLLVPSGTVAYFAGNTAPAGWLKANGAAVSRIAYAGLFAAIGTTFGAGNGSTTFNLPDLRGEFVRGWSDGRNVDSGRILGSAQADAFKSHSHALWGIGGSGNIGQAERLGSANAGVIGDQDAGAAYLTANGAGTQLIRDSGDAETRPRNIALLACIKI